MSVGTKTKIMLWGRAAHRCSFPDCALDLFIDETDTDDPSLVGEICHMVARKTEHARGDSPLTAEQRDLYSNLILLCRNHHKLVDDEPAEYTVDVLKKMKQEHEEWVRSSLTNYDPKRQRDDEIYADYVDKWAKRVDLDEWTAWSTSFMFAGQPVIRKEKFQELADTSTWLFGRVWPNRYPELEAAFENFNFVLTDLLRIFQSQAEEHNGELWTRKFYKSDGFNPSYDRDLKRFDFHVDLVEDLMLELTRAANYVCDKVREYLDASFRLEEGLVMCRSGPYVIDSWEMHRPQYKGDERTKAPYLSLEQFKVMRANRDMNFGAGTSIDDPNCRIAGG